MFYILDNLIIQNVIPHTHPSVFNLFTNNYHIDVNCEETVLNQAVIDIDNSINETSINMNSIKIAKLNVRKVIDCHPNNDYERKELFEHYEGLCKRMVVLKNVHEDLLIKKGVIEKEITRCIQRSKLNNKLFSAWLYIADTLFLSVSNGTKLIIILYTFS
jgi:hypothetical protein